MSINPDLTIQELRQLIQEATAALFEREQQRAANEQALRDAAAVDAEIGAVASHAAHVQQIINAPAGQSLAAVETGLKWLAQAVYDLGSLTIRTARLVANRTQSTETM